MHFRTVAAIVVSLAAASTTVSFPLLHKRIINGTHAPEGEFPMFAQFDACDGTVIGPQTILTATSAELFRPPEYLLKIQVTIGSHAEYSEHRQILDPFFNTTSQICAIDNGYSACNGDSGGPLYHGSGNDAQVVGLVHGSGGGPDNKCGEKGTYQYYTFIKPFIPWIKSEIEKFEQDGASSTTDIGADL
ncbi:unnamed protein product [Mortierella alpina]